MSRIDFSRAVSAAARRERELARHDEDERKAALSYLRDTDWMVIRRMEVNTPVPADVTQKRAQARARLNEDRRADARN